MVSKMLRLCTTDSNAWNNELNAGIYIHIYMYCIFVCVYICSVGKMKYI
jgi:hypothetical protein